MMKKNIALLSILMLLVGMCGFVGAYTITYESDLDLGGVPTSSYAGAIVEDFEGSSLLWDWSGDFSIYNASILNQTAAPLNDTTYFVSVPNPESTGTATVTGFGLANYFGLYWGSVDAYNLLRFYKDGSEVASVTGLNVIQDPGNPGDQTSTLTNLYVNFIDLPYFDTFSMTSTQFAFEADNIAIAPVPEPSTMLLLGGGLAGLAWISRKRKKA